MSRLQVECPDELLSLPGQNRSTLEHLAQEAFLVRLYEESGKLQRFRSPLSKTRASCYSMKPSGVASRCSAACRWLERLRCYLPQSRINGYQQSVPSLMR